MHLWQQVTLITYSIFSLLVFLKGFLESARKNNAYGNVYWLYWTGIFVWGDAIIFAPFWLLTSLFCLFLGDWILFLLVWVIFWLVRSLGETIYWFNQQFSQVERHAPASLPLFTVFKNDSVWFGWQIFNQCLTVISLIASIYLSSLWLA